MGLTNQGKQRKARFAAELPHCGRR